MADNTAFDALAAKYGGGAAAPMTDPGSASSNSAFSDLQAKYGSPSSEAPKVTPTLPVETISKAPARTVGGTIGSFIGGAARSVVDGVTGVANRLGGAAQETFADTSTPPTPDTPPAPTPKINIPAPSNNPLTQNLHDSLNAAFPSSTTAYSTPATSNQGTFDQIKGVTAALVSIPKAIENNELNPSQREQDLEAQAFPKTGNPISDAIESPVRVAGQAIYRFFNPGFEPMADDISTATLGNGAFNYDPKNNNILPSIQKNGAQVVGDTAQTVLQVYMPGLFGKTAAGLASSPIRDALFTGARNGGTVGLTFGVAQALSSGSTDPKEIAGILFKNTVGGAILGGITSGAIPVARGGVEALTKQIKTEYSIPPDVYIDGSKIRSLFQTGEGISPEETQMVKELGLTGSQYRDAINNGVNIKLPTEQVITMSDRPWFAKLKEAIGLEPSAPNVQVISTKGGMTFGRNSTAPETRADRLLTGTHQTASPEVNAAEGTALDAAQGATANENNTLAGESNTAPTVSPEPVSEPTQAPKALPAPTSPKYGAALAEHPIDNTFRSLIEQTTPETQSAFGRAVVKEVVQNLGHSEENALKVMISSTPSADGRPAGYNANGSITIYTPNLERDLETLANGGRILAHNNSPYAQVFTMRTGETPAQLATRYVQEVLAHEVGHARTLTAEDHEKTAQLTDAVKQARFSKNEKAVTSAKTALDAHMQELENRANEYVSKNRTQLHKELFENAQKLSASKLAAQKVGARAGFQEGKKVGAAAERNKAQVREEKLKSDAQAEKLKQRIQDRSRAEKEIGKTKSRYETALEAVKSRSETLSGKRKALIDYAELIPANVRGKFLRAIENTRSDKDFNDVITRMTKEANVQERKKLIDNIRKEVKDTVVKKVNKMPSAKFAYEQQKDLNRIRTGLDLSYTEAQVSIANKLAEWQSSHPDEVLPNDLLHEIQILNMRGIRDMDATQLRNVLANIRSIKETGRTIKEVEKFNRDTEIQQARDAIQEVLVSGKTLPSATKFVPEENVPDSRLGKIMKEFMLFHTEKMAALEETLDRLSKFDKTSKQYSSFLSKYVGRNVNNAFKEQYRGQMLNTDKLIDLIHEVFKVERSSEILGMLAEREAIIDVGNFPDASGVLKNLKISRAQATAKWMQYQDPTLRESFHSPDGLGWTPEVRDAAFGVMTEEDKAFGQKLLDFYQEYYRGINKIFSAETGVDLPFNENYSPINRDVETLIPESTLLAQEMAKYASAKNGSLKERVKTTIPLKFDGDVETFMRHITKMEHYKAWAETMHQLRSIFGNKDIRRAIVELHSKSQLKIMDDYLNDFARDGIANEKVVKWADTLRANLTRSMIGLNPTTGIKRLVSIMNYGGEMPLRDFFTGVANFWSSPLSKAKFLYENSVVLQERFSEGYERDIKLALEQGYDKKLAAARTFTHYLFFLVRGADKLTIYHGAWAAYRSEFNRLTKEGKLSNEEAQREAIEYAEMLTMRVDETSRMDTLSPLQRQGSISRLFTMFMSQPNKYYRLMTNAARNYRYGRGSKAEQIKRILWWWFGPATLFNLVTNSLTNNKYQKDAGGVFMQTLMGPLTYPFVTGDIAKSIIGATFFKEPFAYTASPAESIPTNLMNAGTQFTKGNAITATTYALDAFGEALGVPMTLVDRPIRAADKASRQ